MYAVIRTGGKQYRVQPGQTLDVDKLPHEAGSTVEINDVLMVADGDRIHVGTPTVPGAKVMAEVVGNRRGKKIIVFKYKPKVRYRRKLGHRQDFTRLLVKEIVVGG